MQIAFRLCCLIFFIDSCAAEMVCAPNINAPVYDQIPIHKLACGPISLFNSYQLSSDNWRKITNKMVGDADDKFRYFTTTYCSKFSRNTYQKKRCDDKNGIRPDDLAEAINELHIKANLPRVRLQRLFLNKGQTHQQLIISIHKQIKISLGYGFPPILYISKFVKTFYPSGGYRWSEVNSHFLTISGTPKDLPLVNDSLLFSYVDPLGARKGNTRFFINPNTFFANDITDRNNKQLRRNPTLVLPLNNFDSGAHLGAVNPIQAIAATHMILATSAP